MLPCAGAERDRPNKQSNAQHTHRKAHTSRRIDSRPDRRLKIDGAAKLTRERSILFRLDDIIELS
jgi:hypothetical protein